MSSGVGGQRYDSPLLAILARLVNSIGLAVTLCLGLHVVTRTPGSRLFWSGAFAPLVARFLTSSGSVDS
jgi:hypothetical protein